MSTPVITRLDELKSYLEDQFVILFGSAVSGAMKPRLPMTNDVTHGFLRHAQAHLQSGAWIDQTAGEYAASLVNGYHNALLRGTKFESFIRELQRSLGKQPVDNLLANLYGCTGRQYNLNHAALAFLLRQRICLAGITTNFDNAVELCLPNAQIHIHPNRPSSLASAREAPALIKLHGDALSRSCVATSPELTQAKARDAYSFLEDLLKDQVVLVLGYSGTGDIDISPHLGKHERILLWGNYSRDKSGQRRRNQIDFLCDLSIDTPGQEKAGRRNLLLELAASFGWKDIAPRADESDWETMISQWTQNLPMTDVRGFVTSFMSWRTSWPHVHIAYMGTKENDSYSAKLDLAEATTQMAAYNSSERILRPLLEAEPPNLASFIHAAKLLGFTYWRKGHHRRALSTFLILLQMESLARKEWKASLDANSLRHISDTARHYLETIIEMTYDHADDAFRRALVRDSQAAKVVDFLRTVQYHSDFYENEIAIREVQHWLGDIASTQDIRELFDECMAMEEWEDAALCAQFLLTLSLSEGRRAVDDLLPKLEERRASKLIMKVRAKLRYEQLGRVVPLSVLNFRVLMGFKTLGTELILTLKKLLWTLDRVAGLRRVETGFLSFGEVSLSEFVIFGRIKSHLNRLNL
jgi:hypothetical protein